MALMTDDSTLLKGLKASLDKTIEKLTCIWKPSVLAKCFPNLKGEKAGAINAITAALLEQVKDDWNADMDDIIKEEFAQPINLLDAYIKKYGGSQEENAWRPTGIPSEDIKAHDYKVMIYSKRKLKESLEELRTQRHASFEELQEKRLQCQSNQIKIKKIMQELEEVQEKLDEHSHDLEKTSKNLI